MYEILLNNKILAEDKRKVVQAFPHSVLILPENTNGITNCYSNNEFALRIKDIKNKIEKLNDIEVILK